VTKPTDTWTVTNRDGKEITRVDGATMTAARAAALEIPAVVESSDQEGGFALRRLTDDEVAETPATPVLEETTYDIPAGGQ